jgi:hypothetical protein
MECKSMHVTINSVRLYIIFVKFSFRAQHWRSLTHFAKPLNNDNYLKDVFSDFQKTGPDTFCYNEVLASVTDGPTTPQLLVMFRENFVEHKCKVYASLSSARSDCDNPERKYLQKEGLYKLLIGQVLVSLFGFSTKTMLLDKLSPPRTLILSKS